MILRRRIRGPMAISILVNSLFLDYFLRGILNSTDLKSWASLFAEDFVVTIKSQAASDGF
jgi:hypothetical protein